MPEEINTGSNIKNIHYLWRRKEKKKKPTTITKTPWWWETTEKNFQSMLGSSSHTIPETPLQKKKVKCPPELLNRWPWRIFLVSKILSDFLYGHKCSFIHFSFFVFTWGDHIYPKMIGTTFFQYLLHVQYYLSLHILIHLNFTKKQNP